MSARHTDALRLWSPSETVRFRRDWLAGRAMKVLASELDRSPRSLESYVCRMRRHDPEGWPKRYSKGRQTRSTPVYIRPELLAKAQRRARERGQSFSRYVKALIERDV